MKIQKAGNYLLLPAFFSYTFYTFSLSFDYYMDILLLLQILCTHFCTAFAIHTC